METRFLPPGSERGVIYDILTRAPRREPEILEKTPEELLAEQKHLDRSNWGRLGALVRNRIISWENIDPSTGEIRYAGLGSDFAEDGKYAQLVSFLQDKKYAFKDEKKIRQEAQLRERIRVNSEQNPHRVISRQLHLPLWEEEVSPGLNLNSATPEQEDNEPAPQRNVVSSPVTLRDLEVAEIEEDAVETSSQASVGEITAPSLLRDPQIAELPSDFSSLPWDFNVFDDSGEVVTAAVSSPPTRTTTRTTVIPGRTPGSSTVVRETWWTRLRRRRGTGDPPRRWDGRFYGLVALGVVAIGLMATVQWQREHPSDVPAVSAPVAVVVENRATPSPVVVQAKPTAPAVPAAEPPRLTIVDSTAEVNLARAASSPPLLGNVEIPRTTLVPVIPKPSFTLDKDDTLYGSKLGLPKVSDVEGQDVGELMREAGIPYDQPHINVVNDIVARDPVIGRAVDGSMAAFISANPEVNFAIVNGRMVERHEVNNNKVTYQAPAGGWANSFGQTAIDRLRGYFLS